MAWLVFQNPGLPTPVDALYPPDTKNGQRNLRESVRGASYTWMQARCPRLAREFMRIRFGHDTATWTPDELSPVIDFGVLLSSSC